MTDDAIREWAENVRAKLLHSQYSNRVDIIESAARELLAMQKAELSSVFKDAERLDYLTRRVSGAELRRLGIILPAWSQENSRAAIDAARAKDFYIPRPDLDSTDGGQAEWPDEDRHDL